MLPFLQFHLETLMSESISLHVSFVWLPTGYWSAFYWYRI